MSEQDGNDNLNNQGADNSGASPTPQPSAVPQAPAASPNRVITYAEAVEKSATNKRMADLVSKMEDIMAEINADPVDDQAIRNYGNAPIVRIGEAAEKMIEIQSRFTESVRVYERGMSDLKANEKLKRVVGMASAAKDGLAELGGKVAKGGASVISGLWKMIAGSGPEKSEDQLLLEGMQEELPQMMKEIRTLIARVGETEKGLEEVIAHAKQMAQEQVIAFQELTVYAGASDEVKRRYREIYIPEAKAEFDETGDFESQMIMEDLVKREREFAKRAHDIEVARTVFFTSVMKAKANVDLMEEQRTMMKDTLQNTKHMWVTLMSEAGFIGATLKAAQVNKRSSEIGNEVLDASGRIFEEASRLTIEAQRHGNIDMRKVLEQSERLIKVLESKAAFDESQMKQYELESAMARGAVDKLLEATDKIDANKRKALESSAPKKATSNDNGQAGIKRGRSDGTTGPK